MQIFMSVDIEGIAGIVHSDETKLEGSEYERARRLMTAEANAAIEGAFAAGASEVIVCDSHGHHRNLLVEELHKQAKLVRGKVKPLGMVQGISSDTQAAFFIGYHARAGTSGGVLNHSFNGAVVYRLALNGVEVGELGFNAAVAGEMGVPVVLVSGDEKLEREVETLLPWAERVVVKQGISSMAAASLSPLLAREIIREKAEKALQRLPEMQPFQVAGPVRFEASFYRSISAELCSLIPGVERLDDRTVVYTGEDMLAVNRVWQVMKFVFSAQP